MPKRLPVSWRVYRVAAWFPVPPGRPAYEAAVVVMATTSASLRASMFSAPPPS